MSLSGRMQVQEVKRKEILLTYQQNRLLKQPCISYHLKLPHKQVPSENLATLFVDVDMLLAESSSPEL